jgi:hypothetical protein
MEDYDGIWNCNGLKYDIYEIFKTLFDSLVLMGIKLYKEKKDCSKELGLGHFHHEWYTLKDFHPSIPHCKYDNLP